MRLQPEIAARVNSDPVADRPAQQLVDRLAVGFSGDVPEGLLDAAHRTRLHHAVAPPEVPAHLLPQVVHPRGVLTEKHGTEMMLNHRGDRLLMVLGRRLAHADQVFIGVDPDKYPIARRRMTTRSRDPHNVCCDAGNFHWKRRSCKSSVDMSRKLYHYVEYVFKQSAPAAGRSAVPP